MPAQVVIGDDPLVIDAMAAQPNSISLISVIAAENKVKAGVPVKVVSLDGVAARAPIS